MNTIGYFEIHASDPAKAVDFYTRVFGWTFTRSPMPQLEYYHIETGGVPGGLMQRLVPAPGKPAGTNAFTCSVQVDDFDAAAKRILEHGGQVAMAKFAVPGKCWQGYFLDTDQNTFGLFQADPNAR